MKLLYIWRIACPKMTTPLNSWWRNCALAPDSEILAIDKLEDELNPLDPEIRKVRELISTLELCHHKADQWVRNIVVAIGAEGSTKGLGTRPKHQKHPIETVWQNACSSLSAWCDGNPETTSDVLIDYLPASKLLESLGERSALKEWQVHRVIEKIRSTISWARPDEGESIPYQWLLLGGGDYETDYRSECPDHFRKSATFWLKTVKTFIHDREGGDETDLSLALAIDMLMPCHWAFVENLSIVVEAIGGNLTPQKPFAACGRNIGLVPIRNRMEIVSDTLAVFCDPLKPDKKPDSELLTLLGEVTAEKQWLAASLDKTIRLQLYPPNDLRAVSALEGPDWIKSNK